MSNPEYAEKVEDCIQRRLGRFTIDDCLITHDPEVVIRILAGMIVVHADPRWDRNAIEYVAMSQEFDLIPSGERAPEYAILFRYNKEGHRSFGFNRNDKP